MCFAVCERLLSEIFEQKRLLRSTCEVNGSWQSLLLLCCAVLLCCCWSEQQ
jgi:hypothetical protein